MLRRIGGRRSARKGEQRPERNRANEDRRSRGVQEIEPALLHHLRSRRKRPSNPNLCANFGDPVKREEFEPATQSNCAAHRRQLTDHLSSGGE
jgi:hypothetical protein